MVFVYGKQLLVFLLACMGACDLRHLALSRQLAKQSH